MSSTQTRRSWTLSLATSSVACCLGRSPTAPTAVRQDQMPILWEGGSTGLQQHSPPCQGHEHVVSSAPQVQGQARSLRPLPSQVRQACALQRRVASSSCSSRCEEGDEVMRYLPVVVAPASTPLC